MPHALRCNTIQVVPAKCTLRLRNAGPSVEMLKYQVGFPTRAVWHSLPVSCSGNARAPSDEWGGGRASPWEVRASPPDTSCGCCYSGLTSLPFELNESSPTLHLQTFRAVFPDLSYLQLRLHPQGFKLVKWFWRMSQESLFFYAV